MKIMKYLTMGILFIGMAALVGCKKEDMSKYVTKDELNNYATNNDLANSQAKVFKFTAYFQPGDTWISYGGVTGFEKGDIVLTFMLYEDLGGEFFWSQLPATIANISFIPEFSEESGYLFINALNSSGGSPFSSNFTVPCKAVLVKANGLKTNPNLDLTNYEEVAKAFNLE